MQKTDIPEAQVPGTRAEAAAPTDADGQGASPLNIPESPKFDAEGYDVDGHSSAGYDRDGFFPNGRHAWTGVHRATGTAEAPPAPNHPRFDHTGRDANGFDARGFNAALLHRATGDIYGPDGLDASGHDAEGYNADGFFTSKSDRFYKTNMAQDDDMYEGPSELHRSTGSSFDLHGYDYQGVNLEGCDSTGRNWDFGFAWRD